MKKRITVYDLVLVGLMGALVFVCTAFLKIGPIPTPAGPTQLKTGNAICLLAGVRLKTDRADIPKCFRGFPITLVTAAIMALAFAGFSGILAG